MFYVQVYITNHSTSRGMYTALYKYTHTLSVISTTVVLVKRIGPGIVAIQYLYWLLACIVGTWNCTILHMDQDYPAGHVL